jgi:hypothetical protein
MQLTAARERLSRSQADFDAIKREGPIPAANSNAPQRISAEIAKIDAELSGKQALPPSSPR